MGGGKRQAIHHYDSIHEIWNRLLLNVEARQSTQRELGVPHVIDLCMRESVPSVSQSVAGNGATLAGVGAAFAVVHRVLCALGCAGFAGLGAKRKYRLHVFAARRDRPRCQPANIGAFQVQPDAANHRFGVTLFKAGSSTLKAGRRALVAGTKAFDLFLTKHNFLFELPDIRQLHHLQRGAGGLFGSPHGVAKESVEEARIDMRQRGAMEPSHIE